MSLRFTNDVLANEKSVSARLHDTCTKEVIWLFRACRDKIRHFLAICNQGPFATQTTKFLLKCPRAKSHVADPLRVVLYVVFFFA